MWSCITSCIQRWVVYIIIETFVGFPCICAVRCPPIFVYARHFIGRSRIEHSFTS